MLSDLQLLSGLTAAGGTWGNKMANYTDAGADSIAPEELNDAGVQMMDYILQRLPGTQH